MTWLLALAALAVPVDGGAVSPPDSESGITREQVAAFIRSDASSVRACHEHSKTELKGKVVVRFLITPSGRTRDIIISEDTLKAPTVAPCIRKLVEGWRFPFKPTADVQIAYPFVFGPQS
jgi:hypothetical protein